MTAAVRSPGSAVRAGLVSALRRSFAAAVSLLLAAGACPAAAQLSASATVQSDYLYRGYSLSRGDPAASVELGYDDPSGLYAGGGAFAFIDGDRPVLGGAQASLGYARPLSPRLSIDGGVLQSHYRAGRDRSVDFTEFHVGVTRRPISARIFYSPDYYGTGQASLYAEVDAVVEPAPGWRLAAHAGLLDYLGTDYPYYGGGTQTDWRLTAERQIGKLAVRASLSGAEASADRYARGSRTRLVLAATWAF